MDNQNLFNCLVAWIDTFHLVEKCETLNDLKNGILIAECLNYIDPTYFNNEWMSSIKNGINNLENESLNLRTIHKKLLEYYSEILNTEIKDFNLDQNVKEFDEEVLLTDFIIHLMQLVLGCAVNCKRKNEFIQVIMGMNESMQHSIKNMIQDLMSKNKTLNTINQNSYLYLNEDLNNQLKQSLNEISRLNELKNDIEQKCKTFDRQVSELQEEKMAMLFEIEKLKDKLQREDLMKNDHTSDFNINLNLQQTLKILREDLFKIESEKEKFRLLFEESKFENENLINRCVKFDQILKENQNLKDEIDILRHNCDKVQKLESSIENYKIKLEDMSDLKQQIKCLEETNSENLGKIFLLEEETKKINPLRTQIELYKKQINELHEQIWVSDMNKKKLEFEVKNSQENYDKVMRDKEKLNTELENLKHSFEQININNQILEESKTIDIEIDQNLIMDGLFTSIELINIPNEIKEKVARLYHENKLLKNRQNELNDEKILMIQNQLEDEKLRNENLQTKVNEIQKEKFELECKMNILHKKESELKEKSSNLNDTEIKSKDNQIIELKSRLNQFQFDTEKKYNDYELSIKRLENFVENLKLEKDELKDQKEKELQIKEKEIIDLNEKYRVYLEKAKIVIKSLDPRNSNGINEIQYLKNQIIEKEKQIKQLVKENERIKNSRDQEEQLIASAWYKLGSSLNRRNTDERIGSIGNSFLSQQRSITTSSNGSNRRSAGN